MVMEIYAGFVVAVVVLLAGNIVGGVATGIAWGVALAAVIGTGIAACRRRELAEIDGYVSMGPS